MNTWFLLRNLSWPVIVLGIVVFAIIAARRYGLKGLLMLAVASILAVISSVMQIVMTPEFIMRHSYSYNCLTLIGVGYYAAMVMALCGWGVLAFSRKKEDKPTG